MGMLRFDHVGGVVDDLDAETKASTLSARFRITGTSIGSATSVVPKD
jgi:hypothetical protein